MPDREKVINQLDVDIQRAERTGEMLVYVGRKTAQEALALLKEQEKENSRINNSYLDLVKVASKQPKIVRCKDCKHYDGDENSRLGTCLENGVCSTPDWFCADGEPKDKQLAHADNDTAHYADSPVMMPAT